MTVPRREFLIEAPHARGECAVAHAGLPAAFDRTTYWGCAAGTHTTWIVVELATEEEAWSLVPRLLRDTARVVPVTAPERLSTGGDRRC